MAVDVLMSRGVPEERILFLNLISSPQGAENFAKRFPKLRVVTAFIDEGLDEKKYVRTLLLIDHALMFFVAILSQDLGILVTDFTPCDKNRIGLGWKSKHRESDFVSLGDCLTLFVVSCACANPCLPHKFSLAPPINFTAIPLLV